MAVMTCEHCSTGYVRPDSTLRICTACAGRLTTGQIDAYVRTGAYPCDDCGGPGAVRVADPFREDVHNEIVYRNLCPACYQERRDDI